MIHLCWEDSLKQLLLGEQEMAKMTPTNSNWLVDTYWHYGLPVAVPVGAFAGATMHMVLKSAVVGTPGVAWTARALPSLAGVVLASSLYFTYFRAEEADWWWEDRLDPMSGYRYSYNYLTKLALQDDGRAAKIAALKRGFLGTVHSFRRILDRIAAQIRGERDFNVVNSTKRNENKADRYPFKPRSITDVPASLQAVEERFVLFALVDMLVRLKKLDLELAKPRGDRAVLDDSKKLRKELLQQAKEAGIAKDLSAVLKACEVGIVLERSIIEENGNPTISDAKIEIAMKRMADVAYALEGQEVDVTSATWLDLGHTSDANVKSQYRLALMSKNMTVLGAELKSKLNYSPDDSQVDAQHRALVAGNIMSSTLFKISMAAGALMASLLFPQALIIIVLYYIFITICAYKTN